MDFDKVRHINKKEAGTKELLRFIHTDHEGVSLVTDMPFEMEACFLSWVKSVVKQTKGEIISIDGKTVCSSRDAKARAIHMVSAWANASQLVLGQVKTNEKSNDITAIPALLEMLELKGCIVMIDAMGCQKDIIQKIVEMKADYVFGLKGNHSDLHEDVKVYFENESVLEKTTTHNKGHGRIETREYLLETGIEWLHKKSDWVGIGAIGMVKSSVWEKDVLRQEIIIEKGDERGSSGHELFSFDNI